MRQPTTLTFITTDRCTAACKNCCFQCNPQHSKQLALPIIKKHIETAIKLYPTIRLIVFSGGEPFLLGKDLRAAVKVAKEHQLLCRIVTNAFWSKTEQIAYKIIQDLKFCGLTELNISTGNEHQQWVPLENIFNAIDAAIKSDISIAVNVETHNDVSNSLGADSFREHPRVQAHIKNPRLTIINGAWVDFTSNKLVKPSNEVFAHKRCENLFNTITISPSNQMLACCGLSVDKISFLQIGHLDKESINDIYENQFNDFLKIWLYTEGPSKILEIINTHKGVKTINRVANTHICQYCINIFTQENLNILRAIYKEHIFRVWLKFKFINKD